jgi:hypothetical protein
VQHSAASPARGVRPPAPPCGYVSPFAPLPVWQPAALAVPALAPRQPVAAPAPPGRGHFVSTYAAASLGGAAASRLPPPILPPGYVPAQQQPAAMPAQDATHAWVSAFSLKRPAEAPAAAPPAQRPVRAAPPMPPRPPPGYSSAAAAATEQQQQQRQAPGPAVQTQVAPSPQPRMAQQHQLQQLLQASPAGARLPEPGRLAGSNQGVQPDAAAAAEGRSEPPQQPTIKRRKTAAATPAAAAAAACGASPCGGECKTAGVNPAMLVHDGC